MSSPGDVLGVESCIDLRTDIDIDSINQNNNRSRCCSTTSSNSSSGYRSFTSAKAMKMNFQKEYPPPLPSLGMEMKRYITDDGRLIIREEKTSRPLHDVFRADRSNGRLTLHFLSFECNQDRNDSVLVHENTNDDDDGVFQMDDDEEEQVNMACNSSVIKHGFGDQQQKRFMTTST